MVAEWKNDQLTAIYEGLGKAKAEKEAIYVYSETKEETKKIDVSKERRPRTARIARRNEHIVAIKEFVKKVLEEDL